MKEKEILKSETEKWLKKIEEKTKDIKLADKKGSWAIENLKAYISDCKHFYKKEDFVRSFEAVVYAYGIYETALHSDLIC